MEVLQRDDRPPECESGNSEVPAQEIWAALREIIGQPGFAKAPRMCRLLTFLITKKLSGAERDIHEYVIGLEVFDRDARVYNTSEDPLVRVQMGRLRERLNGYYSSLAQAPAWKIVIPIGNYVPVFQAGGRATKAPECRPDLLLVTPLRHIGAEAGCDSFMSGLNDELSTQLFAACSGRLRLGDDANPADQVPAFRLQGSIQLEQDRVRASVRLIDAAASHIVWLSRFDRVGPLNMSLQEGLAGDICASLSRYLWPSARAHAGALR